MPNRKLKIVHVVSEIEPFSKTGGLANVVPSLAKTQAELGHQVSVITPYYYRVLKANKTKPPPIEFIGREDKEDINGRLAFEAEYYQSRINGSLPVYLIGNKEYLNSKTLYESKKDNAKFLFFNVAVLQLLVRLNLKPDIIHCHDWHTGLIPYFIKIREKKDEFWRQVATLFTIHNLAFQLGTDWWKIRPQNRDDGRLRIISLIKEKKLKNLNFAKRAILYADAINTVSETYRQEIMTKSYGEDLHRVLKNREKIVFGIVNGIDFDEYNPAKDPGLYQRFSNKSTEKKKANKSWLQKLYGLKVDPDVPLLCMTSRIVEQKGFNLLLEILPHLLKLDIQLVIMGDGDKALTESLHAQQKKFRGKLVMVPFDSKMETSVYAAADIFLLPSRFEPCGINQMIAMRYGCIPVVHHIGGLADTIVNFRPAAGQGNGFSFDKYDAVSFLITIVRALETYQHKEIWKNLVISNLTTANSWEIPARKYLELYQATRRLHRRYHQSKRDLENGSILD